jgi:hypothetical protein
MAVQTQQMQTITQLLAQNNNNNNHRGQHRNVPEGFQKKVENFNKLRLTTFDHSADPMDVDNWPREIEKKLELTELTEEECVTVAAHQLIGTTSAWWATTVTRTRTRCTSVGRVRGDLQKPPHSRGRDGQDG